MRNFYLLVFILFVFGCKSSNNEEIDTISIENNISDAISIDDIFKEYKFISLEATTDSSLVGVPRKIALKNDVIFVSDGRRLFQFNTDGSHIRTLNKVGGGPQEYLGIWDFIVSDKEILIWDQNSRKLIRYTLDNEYINSYVIDNFAATIHLVDRDKVLFSSSYQSNDEYKFTVRDLETMNIVASFHPVNKNQITYRHFAEQDNYYVYKNTLLFHEPMNNYIYEIGNNKFEPVRYLDIYGKNPPEEFLEEKHEDIMDIIVKAQTNGYCYGAPMYAESNDQIVFSFRAEDRTMLCSYSKETDKSIQSEKIVLYQDVPPIEFMRVKVNTDSDEAFLFAVGSETFYKDVDNNIPYVEDLSYLSNNGNPVICLAKLK
ncbi:MAG: 6-bladed beta-propeller [Bacteroidales bacterium]|jgi:hypothetical protein|nr:6-bladed beta-propeller [Bacteroidales bacterium]